MANRILGVIIGVLLAGPVGGFIGFLIGLALDRQLGVRQAGGFSFRNIFQQHYLKSMFILMGHVAKADGQVEAEEINHARTLMRQMRLTEPQQHQAMRWFYQGKNQQFNLNQLLANLRPYKRGPHLRLLIECLTQMVSINGIAHPEQQRILRHICQYVDLPAPNFHTAGAHGYRTNYQSYGQRSNVSSLSSAYKTLGLTNSANESDIRKAYRRLMSRHHPDKLAAKGASETELKQATEKTHQIRRAYEAVMQSKGVTV